MFAADLLTPIRFPAHCLCANAGYQDFAFFDLVVEPVLRRVLYTEGFGVGADGSNTPGGLDAVDDLLADACVAGLVGESEVMLVCC